MLPINNELSHRNNPHINLHLLNLPILTRILLNKKLPESRSKHNNTILLMKILRALKFILMSENPFAFLPVADSPFC